MTVLTATYARIVKRVQRAHTNFGVFGGSGGVDDASGDKFHGDVGGTSDGNRCGGDSGRVDDNGDGAHDGDCDSDSINGGVASDGTRKSSLTVGAAAAAAVASVAAASKSKAFFTRVPLLRHILWPHCHRDAAVAGNGDWTDDDDNDDDDDINGDDYASAVSAAVSAVLSSSSSSGASVIAPYRCLDIVVLERFLFAARQYSRECVRF